MLKQLSIILLLLSIGAEVIAQQTYQRIRLFANHEQLHELEEEGLDLCHIAQRGDIYIENDFSPFEQQVIKQSGLDYEVLYANSADYYSERSLRVQNLYKTAAGSCSSEATAGYSIPESFSLGTMGGFFRYSEMLEHLDAMHEMYPELITEKAPIDTFLTHENRPIYHQIITGANDNEKDQILYNSLHHAREPVSMTQNIFFMWYLLENYATDPSVAYIVDNFELHFVPCVNPDGYLVVEDGFSVNTNGTPNFGSFWRKNKRDNNGNGVFDPNVDGVDLNRNYGYQWAYDNDGSSPNVSSDTYRGPGPFSEPETQAIKWLCESNEFTIALNYHAYGNLLIYPWGFIDAFLTPDSTVFRDLAAVMTLENNYFAGTGNETVGYTVNGDSDDYMYGEQEAKNKILSMTPEVGSNAGGFFPAESEIIPMCLQTLFMNLSAARASRSYGLFTDLSEETLLGDVGTMPFSVKNVGIWAGLFEISFIPISDNISFAETTIESGVLNPGDTFDGMVDFSVSDAAFGDEIAYYVTIDNGLYEYADTIRKTWRSSDITFDLALVDSCDVLGNWANNGWGLTTQTFHSSPASLTESPLGEYPNNAQLEIIYKDTFDLTEADFAELTFWAKWDIEAGYDLVRLSALSVEDNSETVLCGNYTNFRGGLDQPIYDGVQEDWVQERIDLSDLLGTKFRVKYEFISDQFVTGDGFYLDDLSINVLNEIPEPEPVDTFATAIEGIGELLVLSNPIPNPAKETTNISYLWDKDETIRFFLINEIGQTIEQRTINNQQGWIKLDLAPMSKGVYYYYLQSDENRSEVKRLLVY